MRTGPDKPRDVVDRPKQQQPVPCPPRWPPPSSSCIRGATGSPPPAPSAPARVCNYLSALPSAPAPWSGQTASERGQVARRRRAARRIAAPSREAVVVVRRGQSDKKMQKRNSMTLGHLQPRTGCRFSPNLSTNQLVVDFRCLIILPLRAMADLLFPHLEIEQRRLSTRRRPLLRRGRKTRPHRALSRGSHTAIGLTARSWASQAG
jgi:hypothetical protein